MIRGFHIVPFSSPDIRLLDLRVEAAAQNMCGNKLEPHCAMIFDQISSKMPGGFGLMLVAKYF